MGEPQAELWTNPVAEVRRQAEKALSHSACVSCHPLQYIVTWALEHDINVRQIFLCNVVLSVINFSMKVLFSYKEILVNENTEWAKIAKRDCTILVASASVCKNYPCPLLSSSVRKCKRDTQLREVVIVTK